MHTDAASGVVLHDVGDTLGPLATYVNVSAVSIANILAARQIQNYYWANTAARTAQVGMLDGAEGYQADTHSLYYYDGATTTWRKTYYTVGMVPIKPGTATGTGVAVSASGRVTCTNVTSVAFGALFTSEYDNYEAVVDGTISAGSSTFTGVFTISGSALNTGYSYQVTNFATVTGYNQTGAVANWSLMHTPPGAGLGISERITFFGPAKAAATRFTLVGESTGSATTVTSGLSAGQHTGVLARDGMTWTWTTGTFTGTIDWFGINRNSN